MILHFGTDNPTRLKNLTGPKLIFWADESADSKSILSYSSGLHFSFFQNRPDRGALICLKMYSQKFKLLGVVQTISFGLRPNH